MWEGVQGGRGGEGEMMGLYYSPKYMETVFNMLWSPERKNKIMPFMGE